MNTNVVLSGIIGLAIVGAIGLIWRDGFSSVDQLVTFALTIAIALWLMVRRRPDSDGDRRK